MNFFNSDIVTLLFPFLNIIEDISILRLLNRNVLNKIDKMIHSIDCKKLCCMSTFMDLSKCKCCGKTNPFTDIVRGDFSILTYYADLYPKRAILLCNDIVCRITGIKQSFVAMYHDNMMTVLEPFIEISSGTYQLENQSLLYNISKEIKSEKKLIEGQVCHLFTKIIIINSGSRKERITIQHPDKNSLSVVFVAHINGFQVDITSSIESIYRLNPTKRDYIESRLRYFIKNPPIHYLYPPYIKERFVKLLKTQLSLNRI